MLQKTLILLLLARFFYIPANAQPSNPALKIAVNRNVELLGLAYFIGFEGNNIEQDSMSVHGKMRLKKDWHRYGYHIYQQYRQFAGSENLGRSFAVADHLWLDYLIGFLLQTGDFPNARLHPGIAPGYYMQFSKTGDTTEAKQHAATFLDGLNKFYTEIDFDRYMAASQPFNDAAVAQVKANLPAYDFIAAMEKFYGRRFDQYQLAPTLTIPKGMGFGANHTRDGRTCIFNVFGAFDEQFVTDTIKPDPGFADPQRLRELSVHEFGHSFVNPAVDQVPPALIDSTAPLFKPLKAAMQKQGYNDWKACLYEHFVRSGEVVIARRLNDKDAAARLTATYVTERSFKYLPLIVEGLERYNTGKRPYADVVLAIMQDISKLPR